MNTWGVSQPIATGAWWGRNTRAWFLFLWPKTDMVLWVFFKGIGLYLGVKVAVKIYSYFFFFCGKSNCLLINPASTYWAILCAWPVLVTLRTLSKEMVWATLWGRCNSVPFSGPRNWGSEKRDSSTQFTQVGTGPGGTGAPARLPQNSCCLHCSTPLTLLQFVFFSQRRKSRPKVMWVVVVRAALWGSDS